MRAPEKAAAPNALDLRSSTETGHQQLVHGLYHQWWRAEKSHDFRNWHLRDMPTGSENVC
jgi:hypothetical protein